MVDVNKQTRDFIDEYSCSYSIALQAALLSKDMCEATSLENRAVNLVLESWGLTKPSIAVQVLKSSALSILFFTDYRAQKRSGKALDESSLPNLAESIYPIVAIVMEMPKRHIHAYIYALAKKLSTSSTAKDLVFKLVDESLKLM